MSRAKIRGTLAVFRGIFSAIFGIMKVVILLAFSQALCGIYAHLHVNKVNAEGPRLSRAKRLIINTKKYLWPGGIVPYVFDSSLRQERRQEYQDKVFSVYHKYSCIRFVEWTPTLKEELGHNNHLIFEETNKCISKIGRSGKGGQRISCCYWKTCLHELGHALGLHHEHTSPIRNQFVRIEKQNINSAFMSPFAMNFNVDTYNIYDSDSIMHYGLKAWSKNGEPTITFLDPDTRPLSKFADDKRYFYLFMELNDAYECPAHCSLNCANGGYVAIVNDRCSCRCPEGLDPRTKCKTLLEKDYPCGSIIELDDQTRHVRLESPDINRVDKTVTCFWFIKSPEKTRILLDFPVFKVRAQNGDCVDEVAVRQYLPGMRGTSYCGNVFKKTVQSDGNIIGFSLSQKPDFLSKFVAKATFKYESDFCYNTTDGGRHYNGKVEVTVDSTPCVDWDSVSHCEHHLFNMRDADKYLARSFCRNPDDSKAPWCYTNPDGCVRNFCDACNFGICKDLTRNCAKKISEDKTYCRTDSDAPRDCRQTCGLCNHEPLTGISETFCGAPKLPPDARPQAFLDKYRVGETITVLCNSSDDFQEMKCMSMGNWSRLKYVCGTCRPGWTNYGSNCYKMFDENKKQGNAQSFCNDQCPNCALLRENKWNHEFIKELIRSPSDGCKPVWLDLTKTADDPDYTWSDGSVPNWTNWIEGRNLTGLSCVGINAQCAWAEKKCSLGQKFVCQYKRSAPTVCADQRYDCSYIQKRNPKFCVKEKNVFAQSYCAKTCELC